MKKRKYLSIILIMALLVGGLATGPTPAKASQLITVDPGIEFQTMDGWGTNLVWWAEQLGTWEEPVRRELMDLIFSDEGLNLNIIRYNFGGSSTDPDIDSSMHPARKMLSRAIGYDEATQKIEYDHNTIDQGQEWVIKDLVSKYNVDYMEAQVNSPPWWMTISGSAAGNVGGQEENLASDKYDLYVEYLIDMLKHFKESEGVEFDHVDPFNEPVSGYWKKGGNQEGAYFSQATQQIIIKKLHQRLQEGGLTIKIAASDETSIDHAINTYKSFDEETQDLVSRINTHVYSGSKRFQLRDLALGEKKPLWMSEVSTGYVPHDPEGMDPAIPLANTIFKDLKDMGVSSWIIWQAIEDRVENFVNLNQGPGYLTPWDIPGSWGLINADYTDLDLTEEYGPEYKFTKGNYVMTKQYYVMKQFSKFIKKGYKIIDANSSDVIAAAGPDGKLVLVVSNFSGAASSLSFNLGKFSGHAASAQGYRTSDTEATVSIADTAIQGSILNVALPANSLTTYVIDDATYNGPKSKIINDNVLGTGSNTFEYGEGWTYYDGQAGNYSTDTHYANQAGSSFDLTFSGNRVKLYGTLSGDSGIAEIAVDGGTPFSVDLYASARKDNSLFFDSGVLQEDGAHKVSVTVTGDKNDNATDSYVAFDRAVVTAGDFGDATAAPVITSIVSKDSGLELSFGDVSGAEQYLVKYGTQSGNYTYTKIFDSTSAQLTGLTAGTSYYAVVSAVVAGSETLPSLEVSAAYEGGSDEMQTALAYYVDAGASSPMPGLPMGDYNSGVDQAYGPDPVTGYKWGWSSNAGTGVNASSDRFRTVRYNNAATTGGISYKFELPDGKYKVKLGFSDPWGNKSRYVDVKLQGAVQTTEYVAPAYPVTDIKTYPAVAVTNGILQIDVVRSAVNTTNYTDPLISWIRVERYDFAGVPEKPYISEVSTAVDNKATLSIIEGSGADYYKVKYGTEPGQYTQEVTLVNGLNTTISNLAPSTTYYFVVAGVNSYGEGEASTERSAETNQAGASTDIMYYTVLGASGLPEGKSFGFLQGPVIDPTDNPIAADDVTGYTWGVVNRNEVAGAWGTGPYGGFGYTNNTAAGQGINYTFDLPNGQYDVSMGFYDPWNVPDRNMDILINGTKVATENALTSGTKTYTEQTVTGGRMTIDVVNPTPTKNVSPGISMIQIKMTRGLSVNRKTLALQVEESFILGTKVKPDNAASLPMEWTSSDENVAIVENGVVRAIAAGTATIQASVLGENDLTASTVITVTNPGMSVMPVSRVTLDHSLITKVGMTTVTASVEPLDVSVKELVWTTDDPTVATVSTVTSDVYAAEISVLKPGKAMIRATSLSDPSKFAVTRVNIPASVDSIHLNADHVTLAKDEAAKLSAIVKPYDAELAGLDWNSSASGVVTVDQRGNLKAIANGTATVTVSTGDVSASAVITVRTPVTGVTLQPWVKTILVGKTFPLIPAIVPDNATQQSLIWTSDKPSIADVDANGVVSAHKPGTAVITVTSVDGYHKDTSVITVVTTEEVPPVPVTGLSVEFDRRAILVNGSFNAVVTVTPANAANKDVTWSSSNPDVASVGTSGKVTGHKPGTTVITVTTVEGNYTAVIRVTVSDGNQSPPVQTPPTAPPNNSSSPRKFTVKEETLRSQSGSESVIVKIDNDGQPNLELLLPANAADLTGGKPLELVTDQLKIVIPSKNLLELQSMIPNGKLQGAGISLTIQTMTQSESKALFTRAEAQSKAGLKPSGDVYEFKLEVIPSDGKAIPVSKFTQPLKLTFKVDPNAKPGLTGVYYIKDDATLEYIGGKRAGDELVADISHFSMYAVIEYNKQFSDVPAEHWSYKAISTMAARQIVTGVTSDRFQPNGEVTRAEFTAMLARTLGLKGNNAAAGFTDVPRGVWYADEVNSAYGAGLVTGRQQQLFAPQERITREEMAVLLVRAYDYATGQETPEQVKSAYADDNQISSWAKRSVNIAVSLKLLQGNNGQF